MVKKEKWLQFRTPAQSLRDAKEKIAARKEVKENTMETQIQELRQFIMENGEALDALAEDTISAGLAIPTNIQSSRLLPHKTPEDVHQIDVDDEVEDTDASDRTGDPEIQPGAGAAKVATGDTAAQYGRIGADYSRPPRD